jgi:hypothetical protein
VWGLALSPFCRSIFFKKSNTAKIFHFEAKAAQRTAKAVQRTAKAVQRTAKALPKFFRYLE